MAKRGGFRKMCIRPSETPRMRPRKIYSVFIFEKRSIDVHHPWTQDSPVVEYTSYSNVLYANDYCLYIRACN